MPGGAPHVSALLQQGHKASLVYLKAMTSCGVSKGKLSYGQHTSAAVPVDMSANIDAVVRAALSVSRAIFGYPRARLQWSGPVELRWRRLMKKKGNCMTSKLRWTRKVEVDQDLSVDTLSVDTWMTIDHCRSV